jgi:hypothetical protein
MTAKQFIRAATAAAALVGVVLGAILIISTRTRAQDALQGMDLCAELDKRRAPPLLDWIESGEWRDGLTWKEAWGNPALRRKIRRVRQEAMKSR